MPALALPRPRRSEGQAEGPDRCERARPGRSEFSSLGRTTGGQFLDRGSSAGAGSMPAPALPRSRRSQGRPDGAGPMRASPGRAGRVRDDRAARAHSDKLAAAHYRRGEGDRSRGVQARPDGAVLRMPRGRSPGVGGTVGFPPHATATEKGQRRGFARRWPSHSCQGKGRGGAFSAAPPDGVS